MDKVNIILCTYNGEEYLQQQLDSLFAQTYDNIDIYIRDDGSTDNTVKIVKEYQRKIIPGKKIIFIEDIDGNQGYVKNFLKTIRSSSDADYYAFCDQDDIWFPEKIERAVSLLSCHPKERCLVYSSAYDVCNNQLEITGECHKPTPLENLSVGKSLSLFDGGWFLGFTCVFNYTLKKMAFDNGAMLMYSHDIWLQAVAVGMGGAMIYDEKVLVHFRRHDNTTSIAESSISKSIFMAWKYRWDSMFQNSDVFDRLRNGMESYAANYMSMVSDPADKLFLKSYLPGNTKGKYRLKKCFYPHRLKQSLFVEIAWRISILMGKL